MNAFYEHHKKDSIEFKYRCFDRLLLNGLIQPFQQPERVLGFFNAYRDGKRVTHRALTEIGDQFLYWVRNQIVVQFQHFLLPAETAVVHGQTLALIPEFHLGRLYLGLHFASHQRRNRIEVGEYPHATLVVHRRKMDPGQLESFFGQRQQMLPLQAHPGTHAMAPLADDPLLVLLGFFRQKHIQLFPTAHLGRWPWRRCHNEA